MHTIAHPHCRTSSTSLAQAETRPMVWRGHPTRKTRRREASQAARRREARWGGRTPAAASPSGPGSAPCLRA
eukprot:879100-Pyramimonas_sp.AAC.1